MKTVRKLLNYKSKKLQFISVYIKQTLGLVPYSITN